VALKRLHVFADNDKNFTGQSAAHALARRLCQERPSVDIQVHVPSQQGTDWLDELISKRGFQRE